MTERRTSVHSAVNVTLTTTTETEVLQLEAPPPSRRGQKFTIKGWAQVTLGTSTTAITPRIRRGTDINGTLVGEGTAMEGTAAQDVESEIVVDDSPSEVSTLTYVLTMQQTAASANGTVLQAAMDIETSS